MDMIDPEDCSVADQCIWTNAQALTYGWSVQRVGVGGGGVVWTAWLHSPIPACTHTPLPHDAARGRFLPTFYNESWFGGVLFWTWRADPTVGGTADDGITPTGKAAATMLKQWWG
jgi:hypothetical protein